MIVLSANAALMIYLSLTLGTLLSLWVYQHFSSKRKPIATLEQKLNVCEYCHFAYLALTHKTVSRCPQCKAYNK